MGGKIDRKSLNMGLPLQFWAATYIKLLTSNATWSGDGGFESGKISAKILSNKVTSSDMNFGTLAFLIALIRTQASSSFVNSFDDLSRLKQKAKHYHAHTSRFRIVQENIKPEVLKVQIELGRKKTCSRVRTNMQQS